MGTKYGKQILKEIETNVFNHCYTLLVLDDNKYYNVHIIDDNFRDEELNTLKYQCSKENTSLDFFDDIKMTNEIIQHALWDKFYGYKNKTYTFCIKTEVDIDDLDNF